MSYINPHFEEFQRRRWMRPDAHRWLRPEYEWHLPRRYREEKANFNPNQPRVPAGVPEGGQWTDAGWGSGGSGSHSGGGLAGGKPIADPASSKRTQLAYLGPLAGIAAQGGRLALQKSVELGLSLYTWLSSRNLSGETAVAVFRAEEFAAGQDAVNPAMHVGPLTEDQVDAFCPRYTEVQSRTNNVAAGLRRSDYPSPQAYGTAVHTRLHHEIRALRDPNFRAEVSEYKTFQETGERLLRYGASGTVRIDVLENVGSGTVCVYDIKTGSAVFNLSRMTEISKAVFLHYPGTKRIVLTEIRPHR